MYFKISSPSPITFNSPSISIPSTNGKVSELDTSNLTNIDELSRSPEFESNITTIIKSHNFSPHKNNKNSFSPTDSTILSEDYLNTYIKKYEEIKLEFSQIANKTEEIKIELKNIEDLSQKNTNSKLLNELIKEEQYWKNKIENQTKEQQIEISQLKIFIKNTEESPTNNSSQKLLILLKENEKLQKIIDQLTLEKQNLFRNPILAQKLTFFQKSISKHNSDWDNVIINIEKEVNNCQNRLNILKNNENNESFMLKMLSNNPERKLEFYENENSKLELEIQDWKNQYYHLDKKRELAEKMYSNSQGKYSETDLQTSLSKLKINHINLQNELNKKIKDIEQEIRKSSEKKFYASLDQDTRTLKVVENKGFTEEKKKIVSNRIRKPVFNCTDKVFKKFNIKI